MRVQNNNNNKPSFGISKILTPCATRDFATKIERMSGEIVPLGHSFDVCHIQEAGLGRVSAVITVPGFKNLKAQDSGFRIIPTIQAAVEKMRPQREQQANASLADAVAKWWVAQIQSMEFLGNNRPANDMQSSIASMVQRLTPDQSASYATALKTRVEKALAQGEPLELDYFGNSSILTEASNAAGIGNYIARFNPKTTISNGIIQINAKNTAPEELYRLPEELMPEII